MIFKKAGHLKKSGVDGNSRKTLKNWKNVNIQKKGTFEKTGHTSKVMIKMIIRMIMITIQNHIKII